MKGVENSYFNHLVARMAGLLTSVLGEEGQLFFRKPRRVLYGSDPVSHPSDFHLLMTEMNCLDMDSTTMSFATEDERFVVFRNPARIRAAFVLYANSLSHEQKFRAYDRLMSYFFDNRALVPFVPDSFARYPQLCHKLKAQKAEIRIMENPISALSSNSLQSRGTDLAQSFSFGFYYTALYHSGVPLREDRKTKERAFEYQGRKERTAI